MGKIANISVFDYDREKICDLYDSQNDMPGSAYNIDFVKNYNGVHTLSFSLPYKVGNEINFRWQYMQSDYMIRLHYNGKNEWFVASKPQKSKDKSGVIGVIKCNGIPALLKTKNIYSEFDDENGIGTIRDLMPRVLAGSGWTLGHCDIIYEKDGTTEKVRSLKSSGKKGALDLINTLCNLFRCRPEYDTENLTVNVYAMTNRDQFFEGEVGRNLNALSVTEDSENIATRLYVEGEYSENGYIGIDDVNPTGLNYIMNFDYYRKIGVFKPRHETALQNYLTDMQDVNGRIKANAQLINQQNNAMNDQVGQCKLVLYYVSTGFERPAHVYGDPTAAEQIIAAGDKVVVLNNNGTFRYETVTTSSAALIQSGDYGIAKFVTPAAGMIGSQEVQVEAKEKEIANLQRKINATTKEDKIAEYTQEISNLEDQIETIYTTTDTGLYARMHQVMNTNGVLKVLDDYLATHVVLRLEQDDIEATFIAAMGNMLRDGYWQNNNYALGQEQALYDDAIEIGEQLAKPAYSYSLDYIRSSPVMQPMYYAYYSVTDPTLNAENIVRPGDFWVKGEPDQTLWNGVLLKTWQEMKSIQWGSVKCYRRTASNTWVLMTDMSVQEPDLTEYNDVPIDEIHINAIMRINDDDLDVHENMFVESVTIGIDKDNYGTVSVSNNDLSINSNDLGSLLSRMSQLADLIDQKNQVYERAKAFSASGTLYADRLNGQIDVLKNQLLSTVSNWRTDEQGNILFESADGGSAMMLCGAGFMIANSKDEDGSWNWRTKMYHWFSLQ